MSMKQKKNKIECFKEDVIKLCEQYELSIAHEDGHGNFIIQDFRESNIEWFNNAEIDEVEMFFSCPEDYALVMDFLVRGV